MHGSCATTRPRRSTRTAHDDVLLLPDLLRTHRPSRSGRSTSSRRTSSRARRAPTALAGSRGAASRCASSPTRSAATDVAAVHAGYARRRKRAAAWPACSSTSSSRCGGRGRSGSEADARRQLRPRACTPRPSRSTATRVFVGSFNFDPRSARSNTEMGLVIESPSAGDAAGARPSTTISRAMRTKCGCRATAWGLSGSNARTGVRCAIPRRPRQARCAGSGSPSCRSCRSSGCSNRP